MKKKTSTVSSVKEEGAQLKIDFNRFEMNELGSKKKFNRTNQNIEWAQLSWNPVTGCLFGCKFCYARDIANRFYKEKFEPTFHPERLTAPYNSKIPKNLVGVAGSRNVFVCSMADLFGNWVETDVIQQILDVCSDTPQWTYLFLTKNPKRLLEFEFPQNSWTGTTVDAKSRVAVALEIMPQVKAPVKYLSCEPLREDLEIEYLAGVDWIIIGGQSRSSGSPAFQPEWEWVEKLHTAARNSGTKIYSIVLHFLHQ